MIYVQYDGISYLEQQTENPKLLAVYASWYCKTGYTDILFHRWFLILNAAHTAIQIFTDAVLKA